MNATNTHHVRFLTIVKPEFSTENVYALLEKKYRLRGEISALESERDLNFRVKTSNGSQYLLKISNQAEFKENVDFEIAALTHIAKTAPSLPVPRPVRTTEGKYVTTVISEKGVLHIVRLLTFLPGTVLSEVERTEKLVFDQGKIVAKMALALQGFFHPAAGSRELLWDVREVTTLSPIADKIADLRVRQVCHDVIQDFETNIKPTLSALRAQIAHMDLSRYNMVVDAAQPEQVGGVLDFGDMHHGPLIQDVAVALADVMQPETRPYQMAQVFLRGYQYVLPLQLKEIELLYDLVLVYLVAYYLICESRGESYSIYDQQHVLALIDDMQCKGREAVTDLFAQACGHPRPARIPPGDLASLVTRREAVMGKPLYVFYDPPLNMVRGEGAYLYDSQGKSYLDVYNNVPVVGHSHPLVVQAANRQLGQLNTNTRYVCDEIIGYAERITSTLPATLSNAFFVNSGSEANELAILMAEACTGNRGALIIEDAYHGWTKAVAALSPSGKPGTPIAAHVRTIPAPDRYRTAHTSEGELLAFYAAAVDQAIASLAQAGMKPALFIVDSAFCSNGILDVLPGYLPMVFDKVRKAGGLCIADEVQAGFGRMGTQWGYTLHDVTPDLITMGKPMANGYPMGGVVCSPDIMAAISRDGAVFATFGGNNVAATAASAVLDVLHQEDLIENSRTMGALLKRQLQTLALKQDLIGDVRGTGMAVGVELVLNRVDKTPATRQTRQLLQWMAEHGVAAGSDGRFGNVLKLRPPLIFTPHHVDQFIACLDEGLSSLN